MIITSPNHFWCCHTQQHTAFPTGRSQSPSCFQSLCYHHLPRKLKSSQKAAGIWSYCCYLTAAGIQAILRMASPRTQVSFFFFCSLLPNQGQELWKQVSNALGEAVHLSHINLKTLSKQTLEYDHLGAKIKKISSSNNGCREGKTKTSPPLPNGANGLSQWLLAHYLHFYISFVSSAQWIWLLNTVIKVVLLEVCQFNIMEQAEPRRKYWCSAWPEGVK